MDWLDGASFVGGQRVFRDPSGKVIRIGVDHVTYDPSGNPAWVGKRRIALGPDGRVCRIGDEHVSTDSSGKLVWIGRTRVW